MSSKKAVLGDITNITDERTRGPWPTPPPLHVAMQPWALFPLVREVFVTVGGQAGGKEEVYFVAHDERDSVDAQPWMKFDQCIKPVNGVLSQSKFLHPTEGRVWWDKPLRFRLRFNDPDDGEGGYEMQEVVVHIDVATQRDVLSSGGQPLVYVFRTRGMPTSASPTALYNVGVSMLLMNDQGIGLQDVRQVSGFTFYRSPVPPKYMLQNKENIAPPARKQLATDE